jgi:hypothetical protein
MTTTRDETITITVLDTLAQRAAHLAPVMTAAMPVTGLDGEDTAWTAQDVLNVALHHGLRELEQQYLG